MGEHVPLSGLWAGYSQLDYRCLFIFLELLVIESLNQLELLNDLVTLRAWIWALHVSWITSRKSSCFNQWLKNLNGLDLLWCLKKWTSIGVWSKSPFGRIGCPKHDQFCLRLSRYPLACCYKWRISPRFSNHVPRKPPYISLMVPFHGYAVVTLFFHWCSLCSWRLPWWATDLRYAA